MNASGSLALQENLVGWYERHPDHAATLRDILKGRVKGVSLRAIDYLVTNYAKALNVRIGDSFSVHREYKAQLRGYGKRLFDPFARRTRISMRLPCGGTVESTVAQLSFFRWAISNGVVAYAQENAAAIDRHMLAKITASRAARKAAARERSPGGGGGGGGREGSPEKAASGGSDAPTTRPPPCSVLNFA